MKRDRAFLILGVFAGAAAVIAARNAYRNWIIWGTLSAPKGYKA